MGKLFNAQNLVDNKYLVFTGLFFFVCIVVAFLSINKELSTPAPTGEELAVAKLMKPGLYKMKGMEYPLPYRIYVPEDYAPEKKYPLILYLHPSGSYGDDNIRQLSGDMANMIGPVQEIEPVFVVAPQCPKGNKWVHDFDTPPYVNYSQVEKAASDALILARRLVMELPYIYSIDVNRVYVTGASAGGLGTWDIISRDDVNPFAAAVPVTGANDPSKAVKIARMPIWAFHGEMDTTPVTNTRIMVDKLRTLGSPVRYTEYKGIGHYSWGMAYSDMDVFRWMLSQRRSDWYQFNQQ